MNATREEVYLILSEEEILKKVIKLFCSFLATQEKVEKYVELTEKTPEAKIMMQSSFSDSCVLVL